MEGIKRENLWHLQAVKIAASLAHQRIGGFTSPKKVLYVVALFISCKSWKFLQPLVPQQIESDKGVDKAVVYGKKVWQMQVPKITVSLAHQSIGGFTSPKKVLYVNTKSKMSLTRQFNHNEMIIRWKVFIVQLDYERDKEVIML